MIRPECDKTHWIPVKALPQKRGASIIQYLPLSLRLSPFGQHICATVGFPPHMLSASLPLLVKEPPAAIQNQNRKLQQDNQPMWSTIWQLEENQSEEEPVAGPCSTPSIRPPLFPKVLPLCYIFERPRFKENPHSHVPVCDRAKSRGGRITNGTAISVNGDEREWAWAPPYPYACERRRGWHRK